MFCLFKTKQIYLFLQQQKKDNNFIIKTNRRKKLHKTENKFVKKNSKKPLNFLFAQISFLANIIIIFLNKC